MKNRFTYGDVDFRTSPRPPVANIIKPLAAENDNRHYWATGSAGDEKCTFADPFVSFDGRDRFIDNLSNLGSFITNYDAKLIKFEVEDDGREIVTKVQLLNVMLISLVNGWKSDVVCFFR